MVERRPVTTLLTGHFKLSSKQCPQSPVEEEEISRVLYANAVGSLMYAMVCNRPDWPMQLVQLVGSCQI